MVKSTQKIVVIGDTHVLNFDELPKQMIAAVINADWVIHVGDYTSKNILDKLREIKGEKFRGVYGNADPFSIREEIPSKMVIDILDKKIGITHSAFGGSIEPSFKHLLGEFKDDNIDIIIYGHTHDAKIEKFNEILFINPGKGYLEASSFGPPTSYAILTIDKEINAKIQKIK